MNPETITDLNQLYKALQAELGKGTEQNASRVGELTSKLEDISVRMTAIEEKDKQHILNEPISGYDPDHHGDPEKDFSWQRMIRGVLSKWSEQSEPGCHKWPEYELTMEVTQKAQSAGIDTAGGFMVAPQLFIDQIIPVLEPRVVAMQAGATMITDLVGSPVEFPRVDNLIDAYWVDEGVAITETEMEFGQISMSPHGLASLVELTNRLLRQTSGSVEAAVRDHLARALARKLDLAVFKGTGGTTQPVGILNQANIGTTDFAQAITDGLGASQSVTNALDELIGNLEDGDALFGKPTFFMHPAAKRFLNTWKDADGRPLLFGKDNPRSSSSESDLYGYPYFTTTQLTGGSANDDLIFANIEEVIIGQWGGLTLAASEHVGFTKATTYLRAIMDVDVGLKHGAAVASGENFDVTTPLT